MQLCYYIALAAPPTRRQAKESEPFLRPEVGFNPNWFHRRCGIDFSLRWHQDPCYRWETIQAMAEAVRRCFPGLPEHRRFASQAGRLPVGRGLERVDAPHSRMSRILA